MNGTSPSQGTSTSRMLHLWPVRSRSISGTGICATAKVQPGSWEDAAAASRLEDNTQQITCVRFRYDRPPDCRPNLMRQLTISSTCFGRFSLRTPDCNTCQGVCQLCFCRLRVCVCSLHLYEALVFQEQQPGDCHAARVVIGSRFPPLLQPAPHHVPPLPNQYKPPCQLRHLVVSTAAVAVSARHKSGERRAGCRALSCVQSLSTGALCMCERFGSIGLTAGKKRRYDSGRRERTKASVCRLGAYRVSPRSSRIGPCRRGGYGQQGVRCSLTLSKQVFDNSSCMWKEVEAHCGELNHCDKHTLVLDDRFQFSKTEFGDPCKYTPWRLPAGTLSLWGRIARDSIAPDLLAHPATHTCSSTMHLRDRAQGRHTRSALQS